MKPLTIWLLPIEPFEERYTSQWYKWWPEAFMRLGATVNIIDGAPEARQERKGGEFLDPCNTWLWKGTQVAALAKAWEEGRIKEGDWIFSFDGWGPSSEAVPYLRDLTNRKVFFAAFWHAGGHDNSDFLYRQGCHKWSVDVERGWMKATDVVFCCSSAQVKLMDESPLYPWGGRPRIEPIGNPMHQADLLTAAGLNRVLPWESRGRVVVFPHRLAPEKGVHLWEKMKRIHADRYSTTEYVTTREIVGLTKERYYRILGLSRVVVSFAMQENYGTAMNEAAALGCWNVAPNWKCYPETVVARGVGSLFPCWDVEEAARLVEHYLSAKESAPWDGYYEHTEERAYAIMQDITERASHES